MEVCESYCPQSYEKNEYDLKRLNALPVIPKTFPSILMALYSTAQSSVGVCGGVLGSGNGTSFSNSLQVWLTTHHYSVLMAIIV